MGCIGMAVDDFCRCTPPEFMAVYENWAESEQRRERASWERARMQCTCMLQPYSRHRLDPQDVFRFAWEKNGDGDESLSTEEIWERFGKVKEEQGLE